MKRLIALLIFLTFSAPASAQWQVPAGAVPVGRGPGVVGFGSASGASGLCLVSTGPTTAPTFQSCPLISGTNVWTGPNVFTNTVAVGTNVALPAGSAFIVNKNATALPLQSFAGETWMARFAGVDGTAPIVSVEAFGSFPAFACQRADGTGAAPTAVQAGELLCALTSHGYGTTAFFGGTPQIRYEANQNWTDTAQGTRIGFDVNPNGTTAATGRINAVQIENDGGVTAPKTVTGGSEGLGTFNIAGNGSHNYDINGVPYAAFIKTLTNTTFDTAGSGNSFLINGVAVSTNTGTGSVVRATSPSVTTPTLSQPNIVGTTTNDNAAAGSVGEYISSSVAQGSAVALTTVTPANIANISLTAGDWDVWIEAHFNGGVTTTVNYLEASISTTSATLNETVGNAGIWTAAFTSSAPFNFGHTAAVNVVVPVGPVRVSLNSTTTVFFVAQASFAVSTCQAFGIIRARRIR